MSLSFDWYLLIGKSKVIIGSDAVNYAQKPSTDMSCATWASFNILTNNA